MFEKTPPPPPQTVGARARQAAGTVARRHLTDPGMMLTLFGLTWWSTAGAEPSELYQRLGLKKAATSAEIRRAYHAQARHTHPDKVEGDKAVAAEKFKRLAEAYEVLTDKKLRVEYDRTGQIPDDRAKSAANQQSTGEEEEFGYGGARPAPSSPQQWGRGRHAGLGPGTALGRLSLTSSPPCPGGMSRTTRSRCGWRRAGRAARAHWRSCESTCTRPTGRRSGTAWWASTARATRRRSRRG
jgi:hypothetical protein